MDPDSPRKLEFCYSCCIQNLNPSLTPTHDRDAINDISTVLIEDSLALQYDTACSTNPPKSPKSVTFHHPPDVISENLSTLELKSIPMDKSKSIAMIDSV